MATMVALVVNESSRACDPAGVSTGLRAFGADVLEFGIDEIDAAVAARADRLVVAGGDGSAAAARRVLQRPVVQNANVAPLHLITGYSSR